MATYQTVEEIETAIDEALVKIMESDVADVVVFSLQRAMKQEVYSFPQGVYVRREYNGGLIDVHNITANYDQKSRELIVEAVATGTESHAGMRIDDAVEAGKDYDYGGNAAIARPFYKRADEIVSNEASRIIDETMSNMLENMI